MEHKQLIEETAQKLLSLLGVKADVSVDMHDDSAQITLETEDTGMLIGYHGETLEAFQLILSLCVAKQAGSFVRVSVEIGEYKKNRTDYLKQLVEQTKESVLSNGQPASLPHLKGWERREVHLLLQDDPDVVSESAGEGRDRVLTIRQK